MLQKLQKPTGGNVLACVSPDHVKQPRSVN